MPLTSTRNHDLKKNPQQRQEDRVVEVPIEAELVDDVVAGETFAQEFRNGGDPLSASSLGDSSSGRCGRRLRC